MTRDKRSSEIGKVKTARLSGVKPPDRTMELDIDDLSIDEMAGLADETPKRPSGRPLPPPPPAPSKGARPSAPPAKRPVVQTALRTPEKAAPPAKRDEPTSSDDPKAASAPGALTPSGGATKRPAGSRPAPPVLDAASTGSSATAVAGTQAKSAAARGNASPTPEGSAKSAAPASPEPTRKPFPTALNDTTKKPATSTETATKSATSTEPAQKPATSTEPTKKPAASPEPAKRQASAEPERKPASSVAEARRAAGPPPRPAAEAKPAQAGPTDGLAPLRPADDFDPAASAPAPPELFLDPQSLVAFCEKELNRTGDLAEKGRLHYELARLFEYPIGDLQKAAGHFKEAARLLPEHVPSVRGARRVHVRLKRYQDALGYLANESRLAGDKTHRAALAYRRGRLLDDALGQKPKAREAFIETLELDGNDISALAAVARADLGASSWPDLFRTLERMANAIGADPLLRSAIHTLRAWLAEVRLSNPVLATELCEMALEQNPQNRAALATIKRLLRNQSRHQELLRAMEHELGLFDDVREKALSLRQMAALAQNELSDRGRAIELLERALTLAPTDVPVMRELAPLYHDAQRFAEEAALLQKLVPHLDDETECLNMLLRIARSYEFELDDAEEAIRWNEVARRFAPSDREPVAGLRKLYRAAGRFTELIALERDAAAAITNPREQAAALCELGRMHEQHLADKNEAIACHDRALSLAPDFAPAFKELVRLYSETRQFRALIELHERAVDTAHDPRIAIAHLFKCGAIYEDSLGDFGQALSCYRRVLTLEEGHLGAIFAMQRAAEGAGRYRELVEAIELEAAQIKDKTRIVSLLHRAGQVLESQLEDKDAAMALYRRVRTLDRGYTPVLRTMAASFRRDGRWADLLDTLRALLDLERDGAASATLMLQMADVADAHLGRPEEALALSRQALAKDPSSRIASERVFELLRRLGKWGELSEALEGRIQRISNSQERASAWVALATLYEQKLQQLDKAIVAHKRALEIRPDYRPAREGWLRLRLDQRHFKELATELLESLQTIEDPALRDELELELTVLRADRLSEIPAALELIRARLERDDEEPLSLLLAEQLATRGGDEALRRSALERLTETVHDEKALIAVWRELARTLELQPEGEASEVQRALDAILRIERTDRNAVEDLEMLALSETNHELLAQVERRQADLANDPASVAASWTRRGETIESEDPVAALSAYQTALELDPQSLGASAGIVRTATTIDDPRTLAEGLRQLARVTGDPTRAAEVLVRGAVVRVSRLDNVLGAVADLEQALELDPDNEAAAQSLARLLHDRKEMQRLIEQLSRAASRSKRAERSTVLWLQTSDLYAERQGNVSAAIAILRRVLKANPTERRALLRLASLHEREQQWAPAVDALERLLATASDKDEQLALRLRLATHYSERLSTDEKAVEHLQQALRIDAGSLEALRRLCLINLDGDPTQAVQIARRWVRASAEIEERADALYVIYLAEQKLGRDAVAVDALKEAVGLVGPMSDAGAAYELWLEEHDGFEGYAQALREHIDFAQENGLDASASELRLAQILGRHLDQPKEAAALLKKSMGDGGNVEERKELAAYLRQSRQHDAALAELTRVIPDEVDNPEIWREISAIHQLEKRPREARLALSVLAVLGEANDDERRLLNEWAPRPSSARPRTFASSAVRSIALPKAFHPAANEVFEVLTEGLSKLFPTSLDAYGLGSRDKIESDTENAHRRRADRLANIFGVPEFDFFIYLAQGRGVVLEPTQPPSVMFPASWSQLSEAQQTFALARPFAYLALGAPLANKLGARGIEQLMIATARTVDDHYALGRSDEDAVTQLAKRIPKSLARRSRRTFEEAAQRYATGPALDVQAWYRAVERSAIRMAAMVSDDLPGAVAMLFTSEPSLRDLSVRDALANDSVIRDLLIFWMSEASLEHRRRSGLLPTS